MIELSSPESGNQGWCKILEVILQKFIHATLHFTYEHRCYSCIETLGWKEDPRGG